MTSSVSPSLHICQAGMTDSTIKGLALRWPTVHKHQLFPIVEMSLEMGHEFGEGPWVWRRAMRLDTGLGFRDGPWASRQAMSLEMGYEFGDGPWEFWDGLWVWRRAMILGTGHENVETGHELEIRPWVWRRAVQESRAHSRYRRTYSSSRLLQLFVSRT